MSDYTDSQLMAANAAVWAIKSRIRLQHGYFEYDKHEYLVEPMSDQAKRLTFMKATQGGYSTIMILCALHGMIHGLFEQGVLYLMPTAKDIGDFSNSKFAPLIEGNPKTIGKHVISTNSTFLKKVGDAFLFLRGGTLPKKIDQNSEEAAALRGVSVDIVYFDEEDLMDSTVMAKARGRMDHSEVQREVHISNPTLPDYGIANQFNKSDQRHWFRKCECGQHTCAELEFPDCVKIGKDGKGYIACKKCGKPTKIFPGEWVPAERDNTEFMHGYRWSQLSSTFHDPADILKAYNDPPEGNLGDVVRTRLGLPYVAAEDRLRPSEVLACCQEYGQKTSHEGPCAAGVDCQKPKRVVIGGRTGKDAYSVFRVMPYQDTNWDRLLAIFQKFNVRSCVVDIRPYEDSAREFQKKCHRAGIICYLCEYMEGSPIGWQFTKAGIVKADRTTIMDATHRLVTTYGKFNLPHRSPEIEEYARQMCNTAKILEVNKHTRKSIYRYRKLGSGATDKDDYRHATNYFYLAAEPGKVGTASMGRRSQRSAYASYDDPMSPRRESESSWEVGSKRRMYAIG